MMRVVARDCALFVVCLSLGAYVSPAVVVAYLLYLFVRLLLLPA